MLRLVIITVAVALGARTVTRRYLVIKDSNVISSVKTGCCDRYGGIWCLNSYTLTLGDQRFECSNVTTSYCDRCGGTWCLNGHTPTLGDQIFECHFECYD